MANIRSMIGPPAIICRNATAEGAMTESKIQFVTSA